MNDPRTTDIDGSLVEADGKYRLVFRRSLAHAPEKVWRAITESQYLKGWFPDNIDVEGGWSPGARLHFVDRNFGGDACAGEVLAFDPPHLLEFSWGTDVLRFELRPAAAGTELIFSDTITELGKAARDSAGWHVCLDALALGLDGQEQTWSAGGRWKEVHSGYVAAFPPEASSIGPPEGV